MITTIKEFRRIYEALDIDVIARNTEHLKELINDNMKEYGNECNLNFIDTSNITNMQDLFHYSEFNGDISEWNTKNVTNMQTMFYSSKFNGDISKWVVSKVTDMIGMFAHSKFNQDISEWDVSNVEYMQSMLQNGDFNQNIENWDVSNVKDMKFMFINTLLEKEGNLPSWYKP